MLSGAESKHLTLYIVGSIGSARYDRMQVASAANKSNLFCESDAVRLNPANIGNSVLTEKEEFWMLLFSYVLF